MLRPDLLPKLPGLTFDTKVGHSRFHRQSHFDLIGKTIPCLAEHKKPACEGYPFPWDSAVAKYPSLYPTKDHGELPAWVIYDKQVLCFDAYFVDDLCNPTDSIKKVKIIFFLEDGTMQINESKESATESKRGTFISRRRIAFPKPLQKVYYEAIDLNIGEALEIFGRTFHIYDCDKFTRQWLNHAGVAVPDPFPFPEEKHPTPETNKVQEKLHPKKEYKLGQFLKFDKCILRFYGYWDDRESYGGYIRQLILQYYLADDTMDLKEDGGEMLLARCKVPKIHDHLHGPGEDNPEYLLNAFSTGYLKGRYVKDAKRVGAIQNEYYTDADLLPGVCLNIYGRAVVLTGCDGFTREFYKAKYDIDNFESNFPTNPCDEICKQERTKTIRELPPWNGFGSFEDSALNCKSFIVEPKPDWVQKYAKCRQGQDSNILRFLAKMEWKCPTDFDERRFVVNFYLEDDNTSVFETGQPSGAFEKRRFIRRREIFKPCSNFLVSKKPCTFKKEDFWQGNKLQIDNFVFELLEADEYTLRYMELHQHEFPKSNVQLILGKIRDKVRPIYKQFVCQYLMPNGCQTNISPERFRSAIEQLMLDEITPHEITALIRHFAINQGSFCYDKDLMRQITRAECRRKLFTGYERMTEFMQESDKEATGFLPRNIAYASIRGAKVPLDPVVVNTILDLVDKNAKGDVSIQDMLPFFNPEEDIGFTNFPFSFEQGFSYMTKLSLPPVSPTCMDTKKFIEALALEDELRKESAGC